jgi:REP element-mobilizing transposase RayT
VPRSAQVELFRHGGKRRGAGRPPKHRRSSEPHKRRPKHVPYHPQHVTLRVADGVGNLRARDTYHAIREATLSVARRDDFRIIHMSIQRNHLHLIVEADTKAALIRGIWGFEVSAARNINVALTRRTGRRRRGTVFADRYHASALTSPKAVRHAIAYVLNNWRHHREHAAPFAQDWKIDPYASSIFFEGWKEREHEIWCYRPPRGYEPLVVWRPRTWLLKVGWSKHHGLISMREVPGR